MKGALSAFAAVGFAACMSWVGVVPTAQAASRCGGFAGLRCDPGFTCRMPSRRGADLMGVCVRAAVACPRIYQPVCGSDGRTYSNDCVRRANDVGLRHRGRC